jgi:sortase A
MTTTLEDEVRLPGITALSPVMVGDPRLLVRPSARAGVRPRKPPPPRPETPRGAAIAITAMLVVASLCGWFLLQVLVLSGLEESRAQTVLYSQLREQLAAQTAPTGGAIEPGNPVAVLTIPTLGLQQVVVEGTASGDLQAGPGHRRDTVLPGQAGVSIVYGRAATYGGPFRSVTTLRPGDGIRVTTGQGEFVYRVDGIRRAGDPTPATLASGGGRLTLVTVEGNGVFAAVAPTDTVYVDAILQSDAVAGPVGRPGAVPEAEKALESDSSVLPQLAIALQGLLLAVGFAVVLRTRLPGRVTWILTVPVLVALAWAVVDAAVQLLPNLL